MVLECDEGLIRDASLNDGAELIEIGVRSVLRTTIGWVRISDDGLGMDSGNSFQDGTLV